MEARGKSWVLYKGSFWSQDVCPCYRCLRAQKALGSDFGKASRSSCWQILGDSKGDVVVPPAAMTHSHLLSCPVSVDEEIRLLCSPVTKSEEWGKTLHAEGQAQSLAGQCLWKHMLILEQAGVHLCLFFLFFLFFDIIPVFSHRRALQAQALVPLRTRTFLCQAHSPWLHH